MSADENNTNDQGWGQSRQPSYERDLYTRSMGQSNNEGRAATPDQSVTEAERQQEYQQQINQDRQAKARHDQNRANSEKNALKTAANLMGQPGLAAAANFIPPKTLSFGIKILIFGAIFMVAINTIALGGALIGIGTVIAAPKAMFCAAFGWAIKATGSTTCNTKVSNSTTSATSSTTTTTSTSTTSQTGGVNKNVPQQKSAD